jgi:Domain of unknown function (DUF4105)
MLRRRARLVLASLAIAAVGGLVAWTSAHPSNRRLWVPEQRAMPVARFSGHAVRVDSVRDFAYTARDRFTPAYDSRTYDLDKLTGVSFVLTPFSKSWRGPAHSFLTFSFADSQYVSISVEARRQPGESYGPLTGLFEQYELIYVVGDERDVIGQRAAFNDYPVYLYPIRAPRDSVRRVFVEMLERANALRDHPEFYNTLTNNCTSNVVDHVNRVAPGTVPASWKTILPGYTDDVALRLGLIDTKLGLDAARERFRINDVARKYVGSREFSARIREERRVVSR